MMRIGVVGVGARAGLAELANRFPETEVVAAVARSEASKARASRLFGDITICDDIASLVKVGIDAAFVLSPDYLHVEHATELIAAGVAVMLEKPMALDAAGADQVLGDALRHDVPLFVGHNLRYFPVTMQLKRLIEQGVIGAPQTIWVRHFLGHSGDLFFRDWHADRRMGNSLLLQTGSHDLDIIHWLAGAPTRRAVGFGGLKVYDGSQQRDDVPWGSDEAPLTGWPPRQISGLNDVVDVEDTSLVTMELENGVLASYQQAHYTPDQWRNYTIIGDEGRIENIGDIGGRAVVNVWNSRKRGYAEPDQVLPVGTGFAKEYNPDHRMVADFLDILAGREVALRITPDQARDAVAVGAAATESIRSGGSPITLTPSAHRGAWGQITSALDLPGDPA